MAVSKLVNLAHDFVLQGIAFHIAIDATCGNGHDTVFLANLFDLVEAFDIQPLAIKRTLERVSHLTHVHVHLDSFINLDHYIHEPVDLVMYNLGFLPGSTKFITTKVEETVESILLSYSLLSPQGRIIVGCYLRHPGGEIEYMQIKYTLNIKKIPYQVIPAGEFDVIILIQKDLNGIEGALMLRK